ncbi:hypothetical protein AMK13_24270 [Streptomyces sp. CB02056]|nr:hypothetical protein AMK13_24270 [Streptomyces sp. CB02056]
MRKRRSARAGRGGRAGAGAARTTSGARAAAIRPVSPVAAASRKAATASRWRSGSTGCRSSGDRTFCRARLASFLAVVRLRSRSAPISSKGTPKTSCRTNATRSAGLSACRTTRSARPTDSAASASCSGSASAPGPQVCVNSSPPQRCWPPDRLRSASRQTREATVRIQPGRLRTAVVSARSSLSQVSCTASSASSREPRMRYASPSSAVRLSSKNSASSWR